MFVNLWCLKKKKKEFRMVYTAVKLFSAETCRTKYSIYIYILYMTVLSSLFFLEQQLSLATGVQLWNPQNGIFKAACYTKGISFTLRFSWNAWIEASLNFYDATCNFEGRCASTICTKCGEKKKWRGKEQPFYRLYFV